jgi:hypothetical protein
MGSDQPGYDAAADRSRHGAASEREREREKFIDK